MRWIVFVLACLLGSAVATAKDPQWTEAEWTQFLCALRQSETAGQPNEGRGIVGDDGDALGPFQIHRGCFQDAAEYDKSITQPYEDCLHDMELSKKVVKAYVKRYWKTGNTMEDMARLWNSGPGWAKKKHKTEKYVRKFRTFFEAGCS